MGLLEKFKNAFFEEEYVEVEEKPKIVKRETPTIKRSEPIIVNDDPVIDFKREIDEVNKKTNISELKEEVKDVRVEQEIEQPKKEPKFNYFDDEDFTDLSDEYPIREKKYPRENEIKTNAYSNNTYNKPKTSQSNIYSNETKQKEQHSFKPTPIISPIYGILDKNYTKDDVVDKKETRPSSYVSRKNADLDSIREKAFGNLDTDFDLSENEKKVEENDTENTYEEDNLLYDMTDIDKTPSVDKVTLQDAEEYYNDLGLEYNIDYKDAKLERKTGRRVAKTPEIDEIEDENIEEEQENNLIDMDLNMTDNEEGNTEENDVDDNLFDLIDSMYDDKEE